MYMETAAEGDMLFRRYFLIPEKNNLMVEKGLVYQIKFAVAQRRAQFNPMEFSA